MQPWYILWSFPKYLLDYSSIIASTAGHQEKQGAKSQIKRVVVVQLKPGIITPGRDKSEEEARMKDKFIRVVQKGRGKGREGDWRGKKKKIMSADWTKNRRKRTGKIAAEMQMIGLQATMLYLQTEEAYFSVLFFSSSESSFTVFFCLCFPFVSKISFFVVLISSEVLKLHFLDF